MSGTAKKDRPVNRWVKPMALFDKGVESPLTCMSSISVGVINDVVNSNRLI